MTGWTRAQAIVDVLEASDGAYGRIALWWHRPVPVQRCMRWGCYHRFPKNARRKFCSKRCRERQAEMRHRRYKKRRTT